MWKIASISSISILALTAGCDSAPAPAAHQENTSAPAPKVVSTPTRQPVEQSQAKKMSPEQLRAQAEWEEIKKLTIEQRAVRWMATMDKNGDKTLLKAEFLEVMEQAIVSPITDKEKSDYLIHAEAQFNRWDTDGDGKVTEAELAKRILLMDQHQ